MALSETARDRGDAVKYLAALCAITLLACSNDRPFSPFGTWNGETMTVTDAQHHESVTLPVKKYGYVTLRLGADSSFEFNFAALHDIVSEREMFGVKENVVLLKAVYKSSRFGKFHSADSEIVLPSKDGVIFVTLDSTNHTLTARFRDESNKSWVCTLVAKEN